MPLEIKEPAQGTSTGIVKPPETITIPDVSSCLAIIIYLDNQSTVAGHVPMMWGPASSFELSKNASKILTAMLALIKKDNATITQVVLLADKSTWNNPHSPYEPLVADKMLKKYGLNDFPVKFISLESYENVTITASHNKVEFLDTKTKNIHSFNFDAPPAKNKRKSLSDTEEPSEPKTKKPKI